MSNDAGINYQVYGDGPWFHLMWVTKGGAVREEALDARRIVRVTKSHMADYGPEGCLITIDGDSTDLYLPGVTVMDMLDYIHGALARLASAT